ncbi:hypothetical protein J5N97_029291 [Dioscorea zingiberensis]|uniref:U3 small nucleolar ribonucleoprotein protein IMP3 n=1 Tax=Dioscorea zingiberensis TaxID=325984 RepID=A0A9D5C0P2_9LILI|nr:hypothetical protein J5N97_029291 [Dioscorea zingiberensis]
MRKCSKIRHIVRLRQMLRRWRRRAAAPSGSMGKVPPSDVPAGHVAVCVGSSHRRFVVRAAHLNHPVFRRLLAQAEEEYGFAHAGPLTIPCDEFLFEEVLRHIASPSSRFASLEDLQKCCCCHAGLRSAWQAESLPLLRGFAEKQVWRRLACVLMYLKFAEHLKEAVTYIQQGHIRVGPDTIADPAFLVTRNMEDFVTWVDSSKIKRKLDTYNEKLDDYDAMN